jgi:hypothetical protein
MLSEFGFERPHMLMESGLNMAMFSGRWIYIIGQLHLVALPQAIYSKHAVHGFQGPLPSGGSGSSNFVTKR